MKRDQAISLLRTYIKNERMLNHCLASEAVMRALAARLGQDQDKWGLAGLLHDLDVELVNADPRSHGLETARILTEQGVDPEIVDAIRMHNEEATGQERTTRFQHALAAGETVTGLIVATTLVYPERKLSVVRPQSVIKRMKEKAFAASVRRESILECEKAGVPLEEFVGIAISAMSGISDQLGL
ncbi:MAG TPA: HDIG domain-containing protein [Bacteroidales bacterium]|nr:HDIG domain-containing protein [Bacteroidales bacterium]